MVRGEKGTAMKLQAAENQKKKSSATYLRSFQQTLLTHYEAATTLKQRNNHNTAK